MGTALRADAVPQIDRDLKHRSRARYREAMAGAKAEAVEFLHGGVVARDLLDPDTAPGLRFRAQQRVQALNRALGPRSLEQRLAEAVEAAELWVAEERERLVVLERRQQADPRYGLLRLRERRLLWVAHRAALLVGPEVMAGFDQWAEALHAEFGDATAHAPRVQDAMKRLARAGWLDLEPGTALRRKTRVSFKSLLEPVEPGWVPPDDRHLLRLREATVDAMRLRRVALLKMAPPKPPMPRPAPPSLRQGAAGRSLMM